MYELNENELDLISGGSDPAGCTYDGERFVHGEQFTVNLVSNNACWNATMLCGNGFWIMI